MVSWVRKRKKNTKRVAAFKRDAVGLKTTPVRLPSDVVDQADAILELARSTPFAMRRSDLIALAARNGLPAVRDYVKKMIQGAARSEGGRSAHELPLLPGKELLPEATGRTPKALPAPP